MEVTSSAPPRLVASKNPPPKEPPGPEHPTRPKPLTAGPQGPPSPSQRKQTPSKKDVGAPKEPLWKRLCWAEEGEARGSAVGKSCSSLGGASKSLSGCSPPATGAPHKLLARPSKALAKGDGARLLRTPHRNARGDQANKGTTGALKQGVSRLKRSKKPHPPASLSKGTGLAVVHGDMDHKEKTIPKHIRSKLSSLVDLDLGDLIEIFRLAYQHWAIYVGNGYVVHLAPPNELAGAGCASLMSTLSNKALVKKEKLLDVVGSDQFRVNNKYDSKHSPLPVNKIIRLAEEKVGQELEYKITSENCEHFVTELRYGVARSDQVRDFFVGATIVGLAGLFLGVGTAMVRKKQQQKQ